MTEMEKMFYDTGVVPVIQIEQASLAVSLAHALQEGGVPAAEITFRTECAADAIREIKQHVPELFVCAGTVLTPEQASQAVEAGAQAIISPGIGPDVIDWCLEHNVPVIPGCATPTEVQYCQSRGLNFVKFFPAAAAGGTAMLRSFSGPYSAMRFMPTGGISMANLKEYMTLPNVIACGGRWIASPSDLKAGNWAAIEQKAALAKKLVTRIRLYND